MDATPESGLLRSVKVLIARRTGSQTGSGTYMENGFAPAVSELRGKAKGPLTFAADGIVIVVDIEPTRTGKANILGQVAADDQEQWTDALVELHQDNVVQFSTSVDDLGAFRCEGVIPEPKSLRIISKDNSLIVISNFEVSK